MTIIEFDKPIKDKMNIALGHFDAIHNGHLSLFNECKKGGDKCGVFLFDKNPLLTIGRGAKVMHTLSERLLRLERLGVDFAVIARADKEFLDMESGEFVDKLCRFNIGRVVVGKDYSFGRGGNAGARELKELLQVKGVEIVIMPLLTDSGSKISTADIYRMIERGDLPRANAQMPIPYTVKGRVTSGRKIGRTFGIPTANIEINSGKLLPPDGVYAVSLRVSDKEYAAVTNIGARPTFDCCERTIESFIIDFDGDIYDLDIELYLIERLRGVIKFESVELLKEQIERDVIKTREIIFSGGRQA